MSDHRDYCGTGLAWSDGRSPGDPQLFDNQRVTRTRLLEFIAAPGR